MDTLEKLTATKVVPQLIELLENLSPEEQQRALSAVMILLGQSIPSSPLTTKHSTPEADISGSSFPAKAVAWMRKYSITENQLESTFSISGDQVDVIAASMPADSKRQQTVESYLVCGIADLMRGGEGKFSDKDAREICQKVGCYDRPNHTNYMKAVGNMLTGSKDTGWRLTNPGFERAAKLINQIAPKIS